jgi:hypothetical protein
VTPEAAVRWALLAAVVVVVLLVLVQGVLLARAIARVGSRVAAYGDLPVVAALRKGERDAERLQVALAAVDPLIARAQTALATIRRGPLPPGLTAAVVRIRAEVGAFRAARRR